VWRGLAAGLIPVTIGTGIGLSAATLVARLSASGLPGLDALDSPIYAAVAALMMGCAIGSGSTATWRLRRLIAPHLAYGEEGVSGVVPAHAVLTVEIAVLWSGQH
jgi:hypothetical protein